MFILAISIVVQIVKIQFVQGDEYKKLAQKRTIQNVVIPANRGNALSSVMEFKQIDGNPDRIASSLTVGSSDFGITLDGPINDKTTFVFSARRSYLQLLFSAIGLPFLPTYNDSQFKIKSAPVDSVFIWPRAKVLNAILILSLLLVLGLT